MKNYNDKRWVVTYFTNSNQRQELRYSNFENAVRVAKRHSVGVFDDVEKCLIF